jgi:hypothetical protein
MQVVLADQTVSVEAGMTFAGALSIFLKPSIVDIFQTPAEKKLNLLQKSQSLKRPEGKF